MKYFLLPFTIIIWFLLTYYGIYFAVLGTIYIFSFNLFWIIVGGGILFGILFSISNEIPLILRYFILKLYGFNWLSCISHSLAGLVGVVFIIRLYILSPPVFVGESGETFIIKGMWEIAPLKTILVVLEFIGLVVSILYTTIIAPVFLIEERNNKENEISELIDFS